MRSLADIAKEIRLRVVRLHQEAQTPHVGGSLSCVEILVALYWNYLKLDHAAPLQPDRDRFILSKGHAATTLFAVLSKRGFFDEKFLSGYNSHGSLLAEHPGFNGVPGVELGTGSLGHGLSVGIGMALGAKLSGNSSRVAVLLSDGECNEGSVWEAAQFAPRHKLDNLTAIIDYNKWQATGRSNETLALEPLVDKWKAFQWETIEVDGTNANLIAQELNRPRENCPRLIIAHTIKGQGVPFMEDDNNWHYRVPTDKEVSQIQESLFPTEI